MSSYSLLDRKKDAIRYLYDRGFSFTDYTISKKGSFIHITIKTPISIKLSEQITRELNVIIGKVEDPKFNFLNALDIHFSNVRFNEVHV